MRPRIYVAGPYTATDVIGVLSNMRAGIYFCSRVIRAGGAPFCPWLDFQYGLTADLKLEDYKETALAWLETADCMVVLYKWHASIGTREEMDFAKAHKIPIYHEEKFADPDNLKRLIKNLSKNSTPRGTP